MPVNPLPLTRSQHFDVFVENNCDASNVFVALNLLCSSSNACLMKTHRNTVVRDITYTAIALLNVWNVSVTLFPDKNNIKTIFYHDSSVNLMH